MIFIFDGEQRLDLLRYLLILNFISFFEDYKMFGFKSIILHAKYERKIIIFRKVTFL